MVLAAVLGAGAAGASEVVAHPSAARCKPTKTRVKGHVAYIDCGPAKATLTVDGRTYHYKGGLCDKSKAGMVIDIGEVVSDDAKHNGGKPSFSLTITGKHGGLVAYFGGRDVVKNYALAVVPGGAAGKGRFHNDLSTLRFTGTWNCHGKFLITH